MADDPEWENRIHGGGDRSEPLADLVERIRERRSEESAGFGGEEPDDLDDFFDRQRYEEQVAEDIWEVLEEDPDVAREAGPGGGPDEHIVPKRAYCEDCEYFSQPPDVHCNHAGTSVVEYVDLGHIRVRNCPVVAKRQAFDEVNEGGLTQMSFGSQGRS